MGRPDKQNWRPFTAVQGFVPGAAFVNEIWPPSDIEIWPPCG
jgi:hypothetical protein